VTSEQLRPSVHMLSLYLNAVNNAAAAVLLEAQQCHVMLSSRAQLANHVY